MSKEGCKQSGRSRGAMKGMPNKVTPLCETRPSNLVRLMEERGRDPLESL